VVGPPSGVLSTEYLLQVHARVLDRHHYTCTRSDGGDDDGDDSNDDGNDDDDDDDGNETKRNGRICRNAAMMIVIRSDGNEEK